MHNHRRNIFIASLMGLALILGALSLPLTSGDIATAQETTPSDPGTFATDCSGLGQRCATKSGYECERETIICPSYTKFQDREEWRDQTLPTLCNEREEVTLPATCVMKSRTYCGQCTGYQEAVVNSGAPQSVLQSAYSQWWGRSGPSGPSGPRIPDICVSYPQKWAQSCSGTGSACRLSNYTQWHSVACNQVNNGTPGPISEHSTCPHSHSGYPTVRRGSTGTYVRYLQTDLDIAADGIFGPQTEAAVRSYQSSNGLTADGIVGSQTWGSLAATINESSCSTPDPPTVDIKANGLDGPITITAGTSAQISWSSSNASSCSTINTGDGKPARDGGAWSGKSAVKDSEPLNVENTYTITCTNDGASSSATDSVKIRVAPAPAPTATISCNPSSITSGGSSTIAWSSTNASSCDIPELAGTEGTNGSRSTGALTSAKTYNLTCAGNGSAVTTSDSCSVSVAPQTLDLTLTATPSSGLAPLDSTIKASVTGSAVGTINYKFDCTNDGSFEQQFDTQTSNPFEATCRYNSSGNKTVRVKVERGSAPSVIRTVGVNVVDAPTATLSANPTSIKKGESSSITWNSTSATSCTASGAWSGSKAVPSGSQSVSPTTDSTYRLTCSNQHGSSVPAQATVNILKPEVEISNPGGRKANSCYDIEWEANNVDVEQCAPGSTPTITQWQGAAFPTPEGSGSGTVEVCPEISTTLTLTCGGPDATASFTITEPFFREINPGNAFNFFNFLIGLFPGYIRFSYAAN